MSTHHRISSLPLAGATLVIYALLGACLQRENAVLPEGPGRVVALENRDIDEASGLAISGRNADVLWLHNDSGGSARIYAVNPAGESLGQVDILGARNVDWEDMEAFTLRNTPTLLIADVGDNKGVRRFVTLHFLDEPEPGDGQVEVERSLRLTYPEGPRDCEAVAVAPHEPAVYLLTKRDTPPHLYRVSLSGEAETAVAEFLGTVKSLPPPTPQDLIEDPRYGASRSQPTAMSFSADGRRALVVTYKNAYLYLRNNGESWLDAMNRPPVTIDIPQFAQTEAGAMTPSGDVTFIASEQVPAAMVEIRLP